MRARALTGAAVCVWLFLTLIGCTDSTTVTALPADSAGPSTSAVPSTPAARPPTAPVTALERFLAPPEAVNPLLDDLTVTLQNTFPGISDNAPDIHDRACLAVGGLAEQTLYTDSGWIATRGSDLRTTDDLRAAVTQQVTSFAAPVDAAALLKRARTPGRPA